MKQLKTLVILGLIECDRRHENDNFNYLDYIYSLEDIVLDIKNFKVWNDYVSFTPRYKNGFSIANFCINDFSLIIINGGLRNSFDEVLYMFLANQFGEEYINYLYERRLNDAEIERDLLLKKSSKNFLTSSITRNTKFFPSTIISFSIFRYIFIISPHLALPTSPIPSAFSISPTFLGFEK